MCDLVSFLGLGWITRNQVYPPLNHAARYEDYLLNCPVCLISLTFFPFFDMWEFSALIMWFILTLLKSKYFVNSSMKIYHRSITDYDKKEYHRNLILFWHYLSQIIQPAPSVSFCTPPFWEWSHKFFEEFWHHWRVCLLMMNKLSLFYPKPPKGISSNFQDIFLISLNLTL